MTIGISLSCQGGKPTIQFGPLELHPEFAVSPDASDGTIISNVAGIDAGCAYSQIKGELRASNLLFVLDRSGSMACNLPHDGQSSAECDQFPLRRFPDLPSKWELTLSALDSALVALQATGRVHVAISLFPETGSACTVTTEPQAPLTILDTTALSTVNQSLSSTAPYGNTPLVGATILGYQYLLNQMRRGALEGENFVVVLTDGKETCRPDDIEKLLSTDAPNALHLLGIRTFAIGVPGSEDAREFLSALAEAGGTVRSEDCVYGPGYGNCHFDMTTSANFSVDLLDALTKINAEILSCSFSIPDATGGAAVDLTRVNVALKERSIPFISNSPCSEGIQGWQYTPGNASIRLCGTSCAEAQLPGSTVSIVLGCPTSIW
jgi:hypothetical protein